MANATCISCAFESTSSTRRASSSPLRTPVPAERGYIHTESSALAAPPHCCDQDFRVEAKGLEPSNLLTASQALYQLSYAPEDASTLSDLTDAGLPAGFRIPGHVGRRESLALTVRIG
jgi:hypothetical protein